MIGSIAVALAGCDYETHRQLRDNTGRRFELIDIDRTWFNPNAPWLVSGSGSRTIRALHITGAPAEPRETAAWCFESPPVNGVGRRPISICERATAVYGGAGREPGCVQLVCNSTDECPDIGPLEHGLCYEHRCWLTSAALRCISDPPPGFGSSAPPASPP